MLPIGVLIPTRNCMRLLPEHCATMTPWLDQAQEIVVVDSGSRDGTLGYLRKKLAGRNARFFNHPPGLYDSWNFGIRQIGAPYTYISTVGDGISGEGWRHLYEVAERLACDVVISPPRFVDERGRPVEGNDWPVHRIIAHLNLQEETCIEGLLVFVMALGFLPFAILGNSANNLYRTAMLQQQPFPTEFGSNGDGAWGLANALRIRLGIVPRSMGFFRRHRKEYSNAEYTATDGDGRMLAMGIALIEEFLHQRPEMHDEAERLQIGRFIEAKKVVQNWRRRLKTRRKMLWPWVFNPLAWEARRRRDRAQRTCEEMIRELLVARFKPAEKPALAV